MRDHGTREAIYVPDAARHGVGLAADRPPDARPNCEDGRAWSDPAQRDEVEGGLRAAGPWAPAVDHHLEARQ
jgi:hypothetical protein